MEIETEELTVFEFTTGSNRKIVARLNEYRKKTYIDLRLFFFNEEGNWLPTGKGISMHCDYLPELERTVRELAKVLRPQGVEADPAA